MRSLRAEFAAVAWAEIERRDFSAAERAVLAAVMPSYIDRRAYPRAKLNAPRDPPPPGAGAGHPLTGPHRHRA